MNINDVIQLEIEESDIYEAIGKAKNHVFIDNLRTRHPIVSFDSKVRGYLGEIALKKWLMTHNITNFRSNNIQNTYTCDIDLAIIQEGRTINCEIKTSKIPHGANGSLEQVIDMCDIKIIKRNNTNEVIIDNDVYLQIYYLLPTQEHDNFLISTYDNTGVDSSFSVRQIYNTYDYFEYLDKTYFVAWDERNNIINKLNRMPVRERTYTISMRTFHSCKLYSALKPIDLIDFFYDNATVNLYGYGYFYHKNRNCRGIRNVRDSELFLFNNEPDAIANGYRCCTFNDCSE